MQVYVAQQFLIPGMQDCSESDSAPQTVLGIGPEFLQRLSDRLEQDVIDDQLVPSIVEG